MEGNDVLKETALLYLSDALVKQEFEQCASLVNFAKEFGALQSDISEVITDYLEGRKPRGRNEANVNDRLRILKEG